MRLPSVGRWRSGPCRVRAAVALAVPVVALVLHAALADATPAGPASAGISPRPRADHTVVCDTLRHRALVFGGIRGDFPDDTIWALSLAGEPRWSLVTAPVPGEGPGPRTYHRAIYDPVRDRMLLFGGLADGEVRNDVWELQLGDSGRWAELEPAGPAPAPRCAHSAVYDPVRDRMVVFGGDGSGGALADVWTLPLSQPAGWENLTPAGEAPNPRYLHAAVYDAAHDCMLVFGGYDSEPLGDVWALSFAGTPTWTRLSPAGDAPVARHGTSAVYDPVRERAVFFGGSSGSGYLADAWALSLSGSPAWTRLASAGTSPGGRTEHAAIHDPSGGRMLLYGGRGTPGVLGEVWTSSLSDASVWQRLTPVPAPVDTEPPPPPPPSPVGTSPEPRFAHTAIRDPVRDRMVVFGGWGAAGRLDDVWMLGLGTWTWTEAAPTGAPPSARYQHSAIHDPGRDRMLVFGGLEQYGYRNDVWRLSLSDPPAWTVLAPTGAPPAPRSGHSAVRDPVRERMIVFGGSDGSDFDDVWALALAGDPPGWTKLEPLGSPPPARRGHGAVYDPDQDRMVVFGGVSGASYLDDAWALTLSDPPVWTELGTIGGPPAARCDHAAVHVPALHRMMVLGGYFYDGIDNHLDDVWTLGLEGSPVWEPGLAGHLAASPRRSHSAVLDPVRDRVVVFGGAGVSGSLFNDVVLVGIWGPAGIDDRGAAAAVQGLRPPAPNPARGATSMRFAVARAGRVRLGVYDLGGRLVRTLVDAERPAGEGAAAWDGTDDSGAARQAGVYFVSLEGPGLRETRRVVLLR